MSNLRIVQGEVKTVGNWDSFSGLGNRHTHVEFRASDGTTTVLRSVLSDSILGAYLTPENSGRFAFYTYKEHSVLCGHADHERTATLSISDDPCLANCRKMRFLATLCLVIGILGLILIIGLGIIIFALIMFKSNPKPIRPTEIEIRSALA